MKIKGICEKINPLYPMYVLVGLLFAAVPLRIYQLLFIVEEDTGFYKSVDWSVYLLFGLAAAAVIVPYILVALSKNVPASRPFRCKSRFTAASALIFAAGILLDVIASFAEFLGTLNFSVLFTAVFGVMAAVYMLIFGISYIDGKISYSQHKLLALSPLFWSLSRMIMRFVRKIAYVNVSDLMYEIFALAFMMLFFLSFARISSGLSNKRAMRALYSAGFAAIFFCAMLNIPRLILLVTGQRELLPDDYPFSFCDLGFAVFAFAYIVSSFKFSEKNDKGELPAPKPAKAKKTEAEETASDTEITEDTETE